MAAPGSTHYGYYVISYEFVYVGSRHGEYQLFFSFDKCFIFICFIPVRNTLVMFAVFSMLLAMAVLVTSIMLIIALRKVRWFNLRKFQLQTSFRFQEYEKKMLPWIYVFGVFTVFRFLAFLFFSIVNDTIFAYNYLMCLLGTIFFVCSVYGWVLVYSLYIELSDLTKLEDLAHLRVSFLSHFFTVSGYKVTTSCHRRK